jgi:prepilin signal peptidase PulO-like enzyme (type II secretory pathway)
LAIYHLPFFFKRSLGKEIEFMNLLILLVFLFLGWLAGVLINHAANVLPLKAPLFRPPFCKRRLDDGGAEFFSTAKKGEETEAVQPTYCHAPRPFIAWSALIAYLTGNQACPSCGRSIGLRSLLVELITPILFVLLVQRYPLSIYLVFVCLYTAVLVLLTVTDLEHRLIQHVVILPAILLAIVGSFLTPNFGWRQAIFGGALGFIVFYLFALIARGGLGEGDVTLAAFLGLIIAFPNIIIALVYGILLAGLASVILLVIRRATLKTFIPYGPFLMLSGWATLVWGNTLSAWIWR